MNKQEVKLATTSAERSLYESLAEVYSIIVTLDAVEKAYLKDSITDEEYTQTCSRLLSQYKSNLQDATVSSAFRDLESFMQEWNVSGLIEAIRHLIHIVGVPQSP
jgi:ESCRT-I complex subunit VPS28